jgi:hypothetical protein
MRAETAILIERLRPFVAVNGGRKRVRYLRRGDWSDSEDVIELHRKKEAVVRRK